MNFLPQKLQLELSLLDNYNNLLLYVVMDIVLVTLNNIYCISNSVVSITFNSYIACFRDYLILKSMMTPSKRRKCILL